MTTDHTKIWLRVEGIAILGISLWAYATTGGNWVLFAVLILVPDLFMLGYLRNARFGAALYNFGHTYTVPIFLAAGGMWLGNSAALPIALIWIAHIGADRALGFGLKRATGFKDTHLS